MEFSLGPEKIILNIGTCPLHIVHNGFRRDICALQFDVDQYATDIHFFFKLFAGRRADYKDIELVTDVVSHYAQKHAATRWVTLKRVVRLLEQHENLKEYFLNFLPKTSSFKTTVKNTEHRYKRIVEHLKSDLTVPYLAFVAFFAFEFEVFLVKFQLMKPKIHILHSALEQLLWNLLIKFVKPKYIHDEKDGMKKRKSVQELQLLNFTDKVVKSLGTIDIGTKAKACITASLADETAVEKEKMFREDCLNCFKQSAIHLRKLPFNPFIKNCSFINPLRINEKEALSSVSNLTLIVCKTLKPVLKDIFKGCNAEEEVCDRART